MAKRLFFVFSAIVAKDEIIELAFLQANDERFFGLDEDAAGMLGRRTDALDILPISVAVIFFPKVST